MAERLAEPIIILGAPRSGTTLLADLLGAHADVLVVGEPRLVWRYGNDKRSDELRAEHATPKVVDHIHATFGKMVREHGARRLVDKTPSNSVRPAFVDAVMADARYVHITRNGWGAVPSMRDFWARRATGMDKKQARKALRRLREADLRQLPFYGKELVRRVLGSPSGHVQLYGPRLAGLQQLTDELGRLEASAAQWRACVEQSATFGRALAGGRYLELKLEDLTEAVVARMLDFCALPPSDAVVEHFRRTYRVESARARVELDGGERALVAPYVAAANLLLGYDSGPARG